MPLLLLVGLTRPGRGRAAGLSAVVCGVAYVAIGAWAGNPGWATVVHHTLIEKLDYPVSASIELSVMTYAGLLGAGLLRSLGNPQFVGFVGITVAALLATPAGRRTALRHDPYWQLVAVGWLYAIGHFVLFPVAWNRFFIAPYLLTGVVRDRRRGSRRLAEPGLGPHRARLRFGLNAARRHRP